MAILLVIVVLLHTCISTQIWAAEQHGHCLMYGHCEEDRPDLFCVHKRAPEPLEPFEGEKNNSNAVKLLKEHCPDFAEGENPHVCCTTKTLLYSVALTDIAKDFSASRCPSCLQNIIKLSCHSFCNPRQSINTQIYETTKLDSGKEKVEAVTVYLSKKTAHVYFTSCRDMRGLLPGTYAMDYGTCGSWGYKHCTLERLLDFLGTKIEDGGYSPYTVHFIPTMKKKVEVDGRTMYPINFDAKKCSESPGPGKDACSCYDCKEACSKENLDPPQLPPPPQSFQILGWDGFVVIAIFSFVGILLLSAIYICFLKIRENRKRKQERHLRQTKRLFSQNLGPLKEVQPLRKKSDCNMNDTELVSSRNKKASLIQRWGIHLEDQVEKNFRAWSLFVSRRPLSMMTISLSICFALCLGILNFKFVKDPIELWVSEKSQARKDMNYFNEHFGPFYRIEQLIITPKNKEHFYHEAVHHYEILNVSWGPAFRRDFLLAALDLQMKVENLTADLEDNTLVRLEDICLSPLRPLNDKCAIQSAFGFIKNRPEFLDAGMNYLSHFLSCSKLPQDQKCYALYGGPIESSDVVFGGFKDKDYETSEALVITIPVQNFYDKDKNMKAHVWEKKLLAFLENFSNPMLDIAYRTERSVEDEIQRLSRSEIPLLALSYVEMFLYITLTLGEFHHCRTLLLHSKIALGFFGVILVLLSVFTSVGVFSLANVPTSLVVIEVLPFLILAVGVDNIFILVQAYQRADNRPDESVAYKLSRVVGSVAPSLLISTISMCSCFFIGASTETPGIQQIALYAGFALVVNFLLQMTCFLAIFYLDSQRQKNLKMDVCCCFSFSPKNLDNKQNGLIYRIFKKIYSPFIMNNYVRYIVIMLFSGWLCSSIGVIDKIEIGLDNTLTVPEDSYLMKYFTYLEKYLAVGPPVYFVVTDGYDYSNEMARKKICSSIASCDVHSLTAELTRMTLVKNRTYIALPPTSWLDNYLEFLQGESCCFTFKNNETHCPSSVALAHQGSCSSCRSSNPSYLSKEQFAERAGYFLADTPWERCPKGGKAMFASSVELISNGNEKRIGATNFMTYHTVLKTSEDFYEALRWSRKIAENLTKLIDAENSGVRVLPYSMVHPFYESYLTMWEDSVWSLALSVSAVFFTTYLLMGLDFHSALIILACISSILVDLMGLMYWWNISLNPATLINLVVGVGISVEFCSHITRTFAMSKKSTRVDRAQDALSQMGSSILSGITLTDCGILILAFAKSRIFRVIYFQMYLGIIVIGTVHGLILLPVLLSYFGPPVKSGKALSRCAKNEEIATNFVLQTTTDNALTQ